MKPLSLWLVTGVFVAFVAVGSLVSALAVSSGGNPLFVTPWLAGLFLLVGIWLLLAGRGVRRLKRREKTWVTPIIAGHTAIFARSSAPVIAAFAGFLMGVALVGFSRMWAPAMAFAAWSALASAAGAVFATFCAVVVEHWCIDDSDDEDFGRDERHRGPGNESRPTPHHTRTEFPAARRNS